MLIFCHSIKCWRFLLMNFNSSSFLICQGLNILRAASSILFWKQIILDILNLLLHDVYYCFTYFPVCCHTLHLIPLRLAPYLYKLMNVQFELINNILNHINSFCHCCCLEMSLCRSF